MKIAFKRYAFALVLMLALTVSAFAAEVLQSGTCGGDGDGSNLTWTLENEGVFDDKVTLKIVGKGTMADYYSNEPAPWSGYRQTIQSLLIGEGVTSIGNYAFYECSNLASATIPDSVISIGDYTFYGCRSLASMTISKDVTSIGEYAFYGCQKLTSAIIPEGVTSIGDFTFYGCNKLTSAVIPKSVTSIGDYAFANCNKLVSVTIPTSVTSIGEWVFYCCSSLTSVTIPESVTSIGDFVFVGCSSLTSITVDANNAKYASDEHGVLFDKNKTTLIQYPVGNMAASYEIPESVTSIGYSAFYECSSLASVTIPESVTSISNSAFYKCSSLKSVTIPKGVTSIGNNAFSACSNLTSVTIPEGVTHIGIAAFRNCSSLETVTIPESMTRIGLYVFSGCLSLTSVTIPASITSMDDSAFSGCDNLRSVYITDFAAWCKIEFCDDNSNPLSNGADLYINGKKATNAVIPNGVTRIGAYAFAGCSSFVTVTIPESVTSIGEEAFEYCGSLTAVTIPKSVTLVDNAAFDSCENLKDVYYTGTAGAWKEIDIGKWNDSLSSAAIHYNATVLSPSATQTADGVVYKVSAANLPVSSGVIVALYKDGRFIGYESAVYNGEMLEFVIQTPHDSATVMAWNGLDKLIPLAPSVRI